MARYGTSLLLQIILAVTITLLSIFFTKLYKARSFVRQLQKKGFVREKPANSIL